MAYKQYTHCISKSDFDSFWNLFGKTQTPFIPLLGWGALQALKTAFIGALLGALAGLALGNPAAGMVVGAAIGLSEGFVDGFCDAWLNRRLICIDGDQCAVGSVNWIEYTKEKDFIEALFDNDTSMNLRLVPYDATEFDKDASGPDYDWHAMQTDGFPGAALVEQKFSDLGYQGYIHGENDKTYPNNPGGRWTLHCEFEGNGMETLCKIARWLALLTALSSPVWMAVGAVVGAVYFGIQNAAKAWENCRKKCKVPIICHAFCFVAAVLAGVTGAAAGAVAGAIAGPGLAAVFISGIIGDWFGIRDDGAFADAANDPDSGNIEPGDCVFVAGDHVYDAGHPEGWHELHPVKHLQKICAHDLPETVECCPHAKTKDQVPDPNNPATFVLKFGQQEFRDQVKLFYDRWCLGYQTSQDPVVIHTQQDPENQWCLHPLIDGCVRHVERLN